MKANTLIGIITVLCGVARLATATNIDCSTVTNVTTLTGSNTCSVTGASLVFSNFSVSPSAGFSSGSVTVGIGNSGVGTGVVGNDVNVVFQIQGGAGTGDILLIYEVTGGMTGIDLGFTATPLSDGGSVTVTEIACDSSGVTAAGCNGTQFANIGGMSTGSIVSQSTTFASGVQGTVWIKKDIDYNDALMSEVLNSQIIPSIDPVPEPVTLSLVGVGLLGIGLLARRLRK